MAEVKPTWSVVATVDEPPALIQAFVAWYLHLGASEVILYFDRPDDPAIALLRSLAAVHVVPCDAAHWARLGKRRPDKHQIRQLRNATDAYGHVQSDWLLHCDADEYLWPQRQVAACLAEVPAATDCVIAGVVERVFDQADPGRDIFAGGFRRPFQGKLVEGRMAFGPDYNRTLRGLTGHAIGKAFSRVGRGLQVSIHRPTYGRDEVPTVQIDDLDLLHFDGLTRLHWVYKLLRKADAFAAHNGMAPSLHRQRQIEAILADPQAGFDLHDRLKRAGPALITQLQALDLWLDVGFDPGPALAQVFPQDRVNLSPQAVDDWIWANKGAVLRGFGLRPDE